MGLKNLYWFVKHGTFKKLANLMLVEFSTRLKLPFVLGMPYTVMIEPTNYCNLRCPLCPAGNKYMRRAKGFMDIKLYKKIIDALSPYLYELVIWNYGEPLLHKNIWDFIKYAKQKKIPKVLLSTNLQLFKKKDLKSLFESNLDILIVSLDGVTNKTYRSYRKGGNVYKVISNLKEIIAYKRSKKYSYPFIELQFIVMRQNEHEIRKFQKLAKELGVDKAILKKVNPTMGIPKNKRQDMIKKYNPKDTRFIRYKINTKNCPVLKRSTVINWDGTISPCCIDYFGDYLIGNVSVQKFRKIWKSKPYQKIRALNRKGALDICRDCTTFEKEIRVEL